MGGQFSFETVVRSMIPVPFTIVQKDLMVWLIIESPT